MVEAEDVSMAATVGSGNDRLCFKLKILKAEPKDYDKKEDKEEELPFVCPVCGKGFKSGKALGGHKRMHNQAATTSTSSTNRNFMYKKPRATATATATATTSICPTCFKTFQSRKALYGHMRSHPERNWRGIQPPSSSSSSLSSTDIDDGENIIDSVALPPPPPSPLTLSWAITAKRGRKSITNSTTSTATATPIIASASHDHDSGRMNKAVLDLMMLSQGTGKRKLETDSDHGSSGAQINKKIRRKMKFVDDLDLDLDLDLGLTKPKPKGYTCNICHRSFSSYQALGGHKSVHNKTAPTAPAPTSRLLDIDLNQPPPDQDNHQ